MYTTNTDGRTARRITNNGQMRQLCTHTIRK